MNLNTFLIILFSVITILHGKTPNKVEANNLLSQIKLSLYSLEDKSIDTISMAIKYNFFELKISDLKKQYDQEVIKKTNLDSLKIVWSFGPSFGQSIEYENLRPSGNTELDNSLRKLLKEDIETIKMFIDAYKTFLKNGFMNKDNYEIEKFDIVNGQNIILVRFNSNRSKHTIKTNSEFKIESIIRDNNGSSVVLTPEFEQVNGKFLVKKIRSEIKNSIVIYEINYTNVDNYRLPESINIKYISTKTSSIDRLRFIDHRIVPILGQ